MKTISMKKSLKKIVFILVLFAALLAALAINASAAEDTKHLAFTSDSHFDTANTQNNLEVWMDHLQDKVDSIEYMGYCGDMGSAYASTPAVYWEFTKAFMDDAESYVTSGFIEKGNVFVFGNHEWYTSAGGDYANFKDNETAKKLFGPVGEIAKTEDYILYAFSATGQNAQYTDENLAVLKEYLDKAPKDIPIIILTHFPLHYYGGRTTENSAAAIDLLNNYPNVVFLWGHNHTVTDIYYDKIFTAGDVLTVPDGSEKKINFTYCAAGCMSDSEYGAGSANVKGKGLLISIEGSNVTFTYYSLSGEPLSFTATVDMSKVGIVNTDGPFTVKFKDGLTGEFFDIQTVDKGGDAEEPTPPEHEGYTFIGWNKEFANIIEDTTVTATYEEIEKIKEKLAEQTALDTQYVYLSLTLDKGPAIGKSGKPIILYPIPWSEGMTVADAVTKLHEMEYPDGVNGVTADDPYGFILFSKIWGCSPVYNTLAFTSENYVDAGIETQGGDVYHLLAYNEKWLTTSCIVPNKTETVVGKYITMQAITQSMNPDYSYTPIGFEADIYVGSSLEGLTDTGFDSNDNGYFTIGFDKPGTYYVVAKDPSGTHGDAAAVVTVTANSGQYVYVNLSVDAVVMNDMQGNFIVHYPMVLQEGDTINDILTELHAYAYGKGSAWDCFDSGKYVFVGGVWGLENPNNCGGLFLNDQGSPPSGSTVLKDGDILYVNGYSDFTTYAYNRGAMFDITYAEIAVGEQITLTAIHKGLNLTSFVYDSGVFADSQVYIDFAKTDYVTDKDGKVTLSFDKDGTYIVTVKALNDTTCPAVVIKVGNGGPMVKGPLESEPAVYNVVLSSQSVSIDGITRPFEAYNIDGYNYFKLRDIAMVLSGTGSRFSVSFDTGKMEVYSQTGESYTAVGGELTAGEDKSKSAVPSAWSFYVNGKEVKVNAFNIGGNNYFKIRDLSDALGFFVDYDQAQNAVVVNSVNIPDHSASPIGTAYFFALMDNGICTDSEGAQIVYYPVPIWEGDTVADAITTLHEIAYGDAGAWGYERNDSYGYVLNKMWGEDCASMAYGGGIWTDFSEGKHARPYDHVTDGTIIYLNNFTGSLYVRTGYFDKQYVEIIEGDELELTFNRCSGDGAVKKCSGASVSIDGTSAGATDENGAIILTFDKAGTYVVTGAGKDSYGMAVCYVVVNKKPV